VNEQLKIRIRLFEINDFVFMFVFKLNLRKYKVLKQEENVKPKDLIGNCSISSLNLFSYEKGNIKKE
jgi:hypothetical protein